MKKLVTVTGCVLFMCIIITSVILPSMPKTMAKDNIDADTQSVVQSESESSENESHSYIISEYNGKIAVFRKSSSEPLFVSDVYVSSLPQADKEMLKNGIEVSTKKELNRLIEDYCS